MKTCPVCNDSFADELNFCDLDGARLNREDSAQDRTKWWSLVGAALLIGALVITAASIFIAPKSRVSTPSVNSEAHPAAVSPTPPGGETASNAPAAGATSEAASEAESASVDAAPELRKKEKANLNSNVSDQAPNPKAAALDTEGAANGSSSSESNAPAPPKQPEAPPATKTAPDTPVVETAPKSASHAPEIKREPRPPAVTKATDKSDKKKDDEKDKKKGGFLKVFKKIFGKD